MSHPWPLGDQSIQIAIDTFCYKHLIQTGVRRHYLQELSRVLQPGGYFLLNLAGIEDGYYKLFPETTIDGYQVIRDPGNQIQSILYTREQIQGVFAPHFELIDYHYSTKPSVMHGKTYPRSVHQFIWQRKH